MRMTKLTFTVLALSFFFVNFTMSAESSPLKVKKAIDETSLSIVTSEGIEVVVEIDSIICSNSSHNPSRIKLIDESLEKYDWTVRLWSFEDSIVFKNNSSNVSLIFLGNEQNTSIQELLVAAGLAAWDDNSNLPDSVEVIPRIKLAQEKASRDRIGIWSAPQDTAFHEVKTRDDFIDLVDSDVFPIWEAMDKHVRSVKSYPRTLSELTLSSALDSAERNVLNEHLKKPIDVIYVRPLPEALGATPILFAFCKGKESLGAAYLRKSDGKIVHFEYGEKIIAKILEYSGKNASIGFNGTDFISFMKIEGISASVYSPTGPQSWAIQSASSSGRIVTGSGGIAENGDIYGADNDGDGRTETESVKGYYKKDGTYVRGHYRAKRSK